MRRAVRYGAWAGLFTTVGYAGFSAYAQIRTKRWIAQREIDSSSPTGNDPVVQYAAMRLHGRYVNPFPEYRHQTIFEFVFCRFLELFATEPRGGVPKHIEVLQAMLPTATPDFKVLAGATTSWRMPWPRNRMTFTWIGQSCAFVQLPGRKPVNVLTDPMFSDSVINKNIGPQRLVPSACKVEDFPVPDVVLVSHDHQDHLDFQAAKAIGNDAAWVVPLGVGARLNQLGISNVREMTWWQREPLPGVDPKLGYEVACTPAMHWSGRRLWDANQTLWCSFLILRDGKPLFFHAGDTGYATGLFTGIAQVYGEGCKLAMLPCGAYTPQWHLRSQHMNPDDALRAMQDLGASKMIGVHWGTFVMSEEPFFEPPRRLMKAAMQHRRPADAIAPVFGRTLVFRV